MNRTVRNILESSGALAALALPACATTSKPAVCDAPQGSSADVQSLATDDTAFAVRLYSVGLTTGALSGNVILSPYSVSSTLAMVDVGAAGETASQLQSVLHLPGTGAAAATANAGLACGLETDGSQDGNTLDIANSVWGDQSVTFEPAFVSTLASGYVAPLQEVNFVGDASGAAGKINSWVSNETQGKIPTLLDPTDVDETTRLVLVNAIYFKGAWATAFDATQTAPLPFTLADGTVVQTTTMTGMVSVTEGGNEALLVAELKYRGGSLAMDFLMPTATSSGLAAFESTLTPDILSSELATLTPVNLGQVYLPKFSFTTRIVLDPLLKEMGLTDVFVHGTADLSGMDGAMDLSVGTVVQQALVEVDEQGTVAAAATGASVCNCAVAEEPTIIRIDHPFLFLIRDTRTQAILFMGQVMDPRN